MVQRLTSELALKLVADVSEGEAKAKAALKNIDQALTQIGRRRAGEARFEQIAEGFAKATAKVAELKTAMAGAENPTKRMQRAYANAVAAAEQAGQRLVRQKALLEDNARTLKTMGVAVTDLAGAETKLKDAAQGAADAIAAEGQARTRAARMRAGWLKEMKRAGDEEIAEHRRVTEEANRRAAAARAVLGAGMMYAGYAARGQVVDIADRAVSLDLAQRQQVAFGNISEEAQKSILRAQADKVAQATRFTIPDVLGGQTRILESLPSTFEGDIRAEIAKAIAGNAVNYALAIPGGIDMQTAGHTVIAYLKALNRDISTPEKAAAESQRAVDIMLKASKLSGLEHNDIAEFIRFGGSPGTFAGFSDPFKFAILAAQKRAGLDGALSGTFLRALAGYSVAPTPKGLGALADAGISYDQFTTMKETPTAENFSKGLLQRYGIALTPDQLKRIQGKMDDTYTNDQGEELPLMSDRSRFISELLPIVEENFERTKQGKVRASDRAKVVKDLNAYYNDTIGSVDVEGLFRAIVKADPSMGVLNAFLGKQQGGRFIALLQQMKYFEHDVDTLGQVPQGFGKGIADYLTAGLYGSQQNAQGSIETAKTRIGEAYDSKLKWFFDKVGDVGDKIAGLSEGGRIAAGALLGLAAAAGLAAGGIALWRGAGALGGLFSGGGKAAAGAALATVPGKVAAGGPGLWRMALNGLGFLSVLPQMPDDQAGVVKMFQDNQKKDATSNDWLVQNVPGMWAMDAAERRRRGIYLPWEERYTDDALRRPYDRSAAPGGIDYLRLGGAPSDSYRYPGAGASGEATGKALGDGVAKGLGQQSNAVIDEMRKLLDDLKSLASNGVTVPVRIDSAGVQAAATDARGKADAQVESMLRSIQADTEFA